MSFGERRAFGEEGNLLQISSYSTGPSPTLWSHAAATLYPGIRGRLPVIQPATLLALTRLPLVSSISKGYHRSHNPFFFFSSQFLPLGDYGRFSGFF